MAKKYDKYLDMDASKLSDAMLKEAVEQLAKTANTRLRELEKVRGTEPIAQHSSAYDYIERLAFDAENVRKGDEAKREFIKAGKSGAPIFSRAVNTMSKKTLKNELKALQNFIGAETSTVTGTKKQFMKSYTAFNEVMGTKLSQKQYKGFWEDALIKHAIELFYSEINNLFTFVSKKRITAEEFAKALEDLGVTKETTEEDLDALNITYEKLESTLKNFRASTKDATKDQTLTLPEDL